MNYYVISKIEEGFFFLTRTRKEHYFWVGVGEAENIDLDEFPELKVVLLLLLILMSWHIYLMC